MNVCPKTLTIAGSDSGGGAGIQGDLKTFSALGAFGSTVITALTAQNTLGVQAIYDIPPEFVSKQIDSVLSDLKSDAIKIGMLHRVPIIEVVARQLNHYPHIPVVLDPVMVAKGGHSLLAEEAISALKAELFPRATLITPNIPEAEKLLAMKILTPHDMEVAVRELASNAANVLLKGGHLSGSRCLDCFYMRGDDSLHWFENVRIDTPNTHGTGCSLSSAVTVFLAQGKPLLQAVSLAIEYVHNVIEKSQFYRLGQGHGPLLHNLIV